MEGSAGRSWPASTNLPHKTAKKLHEPAQSRLPEERRSELWGSQEPVKVTRPADDTFGDAMNRRPKLSIVAPGASAEEAAAVVAALERFMRETAPRSAPSHAHRNSWLDAA